jgi:ATP-dependent Lhr-like helicase
VKKKASASSSGTALAGFSAPVQAWFAASFAAPTHAQTLGLPVIASGASTLLLAPTGSGKTLTAFLSALDKLMFHSAQADAQPGDVSVLYVSPLKALAVDIEKNLRAPLVGIGHAAKRLNVPFREPSIFVRSGDTHASERRAFQRSGADIVITTPESLYLMLTSEIARRFARVQTVIIDEIHVMAGTKRGSHLFLSLERLEALRSAERPLQRIGLSATVRPLEPVARALAGLTLTGEPRPVTIIDAGTRRALELSIEVPARDMKNLSERDVGPGSAAESLESGEAPRKGGSIWPTIYPRLVALILQHRTTLVFVNNRRLAERLAQAINELAEQELALAHHGSIAHERRSIIEDRLKRGDVRAIIATSSLELGIDMGTIDLVVQIEAPPTVSAGLQRVGRAGHNVASVSRGVVIPKFRGDLLASAATVLAMKNGEVEQTRIPENPLDILAQQVVAIVAERSIGYDELGALVRGAYPFRALPKSAFDGVLDMLTGRYPSHEFSELSPRINWDRVSNVLSGRRSSKRLAIISGGTIPDRGLFGVFLDGAEKPIRIGELDEEMVFESRVGEIFLLGASSWRITEITNDRVLALPAPGEAGKMPFWRGDRASRPFELGLKIGALARTLSGLSRERSLALLEKEHGMDENARENLVRLIEEQKAATGELPSDKTIVIERFLDELGDQRICVLCPFGSRILAPWAMAIRSRLVAESALDVDVIYSDDGIIFRIADVESAPPPLSLIPSPGEVEGELERGLSSTALFAARFRENAARSLLLPKKSPQKRMPLWAQRRRAAELLAVAANYPSFPLLLETYRECMKDIFDVPALLEVLSGIESRAIRVVQVDTEVPSPLAASLLFSYVANFMYEGDSPLAERRAQALTLDPDRLRELLGEVELAELLDAQALDEVSLAAAGTRLCANADHVHDLLLSVGDRSEAELVARLLDPGGWPALRQELLVSRRAVMVRIASEERWIAIEDAAAYRDALGVVPPPGLPQALLAPVEHALRGLLQRYARTHGPFSVHEVEQRFGIGPEELLLALEQLIAAGRVVRGRFRTAGAAIEFVDRDILRAIKRKSLAKLRREVEPVPAEALARFSVLHHELVSPRRGLDAVLTTIERLEGLALPASVWFDDLFPSRVRGFSPSMLDELCLAGEVTWRGVAPLGDSDGRVGFFIADRVGLLAQPAKEVPGELAQRVLQAVQQRGALFFHQLMEHVGGFPNDVLDCVWDLVFAGWLTNDSTVPLRSRFDKAHSAQRPQRFRSRRKSLPGSEGRFSLMAQPVGDPTLRLQALTTVLLERHGVLTRDNLEMEAVVGGFSAIYPVLRALEEAGRVRRGYFVEGLGAAQFANPSIAERLRSCREPSEEPAMLVLSALDPANLYGTLLPWPSRSAQDRLMRAAGSHVVLNDGALAAYVARGAQSVICFAPEDAREVRAFAERLARTLARWSMETRHEPMHLKLLNGEDAAKSGLAEGFVAGGFVRSGTGLLLRSESRRGPLSSSRLSD